MNINILFLSLGSLMILSSCGGSKKAPKNERVVAMESQMEEKGAISEEK